MPRTARSLKVNPRDPRASVEGACRYLWQMDSAWKSIANEDERIKFILASYNVGTGHVQDAVRLAEKFGDDPKSWDDVAYWLVRKSKRNVYNDPVVKHGYARGTEPVAYVDQILGRFENYRQFVEEAPATGVGGLEARPPHLLARFTITAASTITPTPAAAANITCCCCFDVVTRPRSFSGCGARPWRK